MTDAPNNEEKTLSVAPEDRKDDLRWDAVMEGWEYPDDDGRDRMSPGLAAAMDRGAFAYCYLSDVFVRLLDAHFGGPNWSWGYNRDASGDLGEVMEFTNAKPGEPAPANPIVVRARMMALGTQSDILQTVRWTWAAVRGDRSAADMAIGERVVSLATAAEVTELAGGPEAPDLTVDRNAICASVLAMAIFELLRTDAGDDGPGATLGIPWVIPFDGGSLYALLDTATLTLNGEPLVFDTNPSRGVTRPAVLAIGTVNDRFPIPNPKAAVAAFAEFLELPTEQVSETTIAIGSGVDTGRLEVDIDNDKRRILAVRAVVVPMGDDILLGQA